MGNSNSGVSPRFLLSEVAVPWFLSDLETTQEIRGIEPGRVFCLTPIKVSKGREACSDQKKQQAGSKRNG